MSDNFERRQPTAAEVAHGLGLEVDMLRQRIAELEASLHNMDIAEEQERNAKAVMLKALAERDAVMLKALAERDAAYKRIAELEAENERLRAERWEPVEDSGEVFVTGKFFKTVIYRWWMEDEVLVMEHIPTGTQSRCRIPAGHAVCRKEARND